VDNEIMVETIDELQMTSAPKNYWLQRVVVVIFSLSVIQCNLEKIHFPDYTPCYTP